MKELTVISGKGGTGKTSLVAAFAGMAESAVLADCDVDAADLHLILEPEIQHREDFSGGKQAHILPEACTACGTCQEVCAFDALRFAAPPNRYKTGHYRVEPLSCEGCGVCAWYCPEQAIEFAPAIQGQWFLSETRHGPMVHARLGIAADNSGKLVSLVRKQAHALAESRGKSLIIVDGPPGIGCPVIASISGVDLVLVVTEPTVSGLHDLERVAQLALHFGVPGLVCVNKWDLNAEMAAKIEDCAQQHSFALAGRVRYDPAVTEAQQNRQAATEYHSHGVASDIQKVWQAVAAHLAQAHDAHDKSALRT